MKRLFILLILLLFSTKIEAQKKRNYPHKKTHKISRVKGSISSENNHDIAVNAETDTIPKNTTDNFLLQEIDQFPIFEQCKDLEKDKTTQRICFQNQLNRHIMNNINMDHVELSNGVVKVNFKINKEGMVEILSTSGIHKLQIEEAKRVIMLLPKLIPAQKNGKNVYVTFRYPINFKFN